MEVAGLAIGIVGIIPVILKCGEVVQRVYENVHVNFQGKANRINMKINVLAGKMLEIQEAVFEDTALVEDVIKLNNNLEALQGYLQTLPKSTIIRRIYHHNTIEAKLNEILELVVCCERSFQTSCACHLVATSERIQSDVKTAKSSILATENNTRSLLDSFGDFQQRMEKSRQAQWLQSEAMISVKVRSFGCSSALELSYAVRPTHTIGNILSRMRKENYDVEDIHFFSWSKQRHGLTASGQIWRYRDECEGIKTIKIECGQKDEMDVEWRLEYICSPNIFTLFLVHGLQQETGLTIPHPVNTISPDLFSKAYPSCRKLRILKCHHILNGNLLDWTNSEELQKVKPFACALCIEVTECT
ncbi:hypothetical protein FRC03_012334 [Tulasnella sp. 419]|nr:hypothetical protein FRC03_012334 [Tulasnella sp. 419]